MRAADPGAPRRIGGLRRFDGLRRRRVRAAAWALCGALLSGLVGALVGLAGADEALANSRDRRWKSLETEHFHVHYQAGVEEAAARAAMLAERAYARLSVDLGHATFLKVQLILSDDTDSANGRANAAPYPWIRGFVAAPDSMSVLETYDDWLDVLLTHELVHVLHLDTVHGIARVANAIIGLGVGKWWTPSGIQPWLMVEGLATYEESRLTSGGRHRSAQFETMLRMHVLEQGFLSLSQATSEINRFPYGTVRYLYGLHFLHYLGGRYGHDKIRELSHAFAGQTIPYGTGRAFKKVVGVDLEQLWREFELDTTRRFQDQARRIRARGVREGRRLTFSPSNAASSQFTRHPFWSPDDQHIYFYEDDGQMNPGLRRIKATGGRMREGLGIGRQGMNLDVETVIQLQQAGSGSFIAGSSDMVFEVAFTQDFRYSWNDLYRWRAPNPNHLDRLTTGMRARDPHVSPTATRWSSRVTTSPSRASPSSTSTRSTSPTSRRRADRPGLLAALGPRRRAGRLQRLVRGRLPRHLRLRSTHRRDRADHRRSLPRHRALVDPRRALHPLLQRPRRDLQRLRV
ncbi:MAG: hypothetical protein R3B09_26635 [Nannocystaceae bacterium]